MVQQVVSIGNSKGIRLPQAILKHCGIGDHVEIEIRGEELVLRRLPKPFSGTSFYSLAEADDLTIQLMLREVDSGTLAIALVDAPEDVKTRIAANVSTRAWEMLSADVSRMEAADTKALLIEMNRSVITNLLVDQH